jgi:hypothetical protein
MPTSNSISVTVRIPSALIDAAKEKLPGAGNTELVTTALRYWLGIDLDQANLSAVSVTEERFQFIEAQLAAIQEQIEGIDRSPKKTPKAPKPISDGLTYSEFNREFGTNIKRGDKAESVNAELVRLGLTDQYCFKSSVNKIFRIEGDV